MTNYASKTTVSPEKTRNEIEQTFTKYGARKYAYYSDLEENRAVIQFEMSGRRYRLTLILPTQGEHRTKAAYDQALRQIWRAFLLVIKAKLVAVEQGISMLEEEFAASLLLPNGMTVGEWVLPQVAASYAAQTMPAFLPGVPAAQRQLLLATATESEDPA